MHYLILGEDSKAKDEIISSLRKKLLSSNDALKFDCDVLYAGHLSSEDLKKSLLALPAVAKARVVILHEGENLKPPQKEILKSFFASDQKSAVLVLEAELSSQDKFIQEISRYAEIKEFGVKQKENIFAVTRMMQSGRYAGALSVLHEILDNGQHPLQIMGGLVWFWGNKAKQKISGESFEKGLLYLQEADLNIKRSKLPPECALELLIAKLCVLLNQ
ncbi:MAG: hypothetical protein AB1650_03720 [Candidatus Omnitrophota bacterium]